MSPNNTGVINLHVDVGDTTTKVADLGKTFAGLGNEVNAVGASITDALHSVALSLEEIESGIQSINNLLLEAAASVSNVAASGAEGNQTGGFLESIKSSYDTLVAFIKSIEGFDASNGKITTLFEELVTAPNIANLLKSMLPKTSTLVSTIGEWASTNLAPAFTKAFTDLSAMIGATSGTLLSSLKNVFQDVGPFISAHISEIGGNFSGLGAVFSTIGTKFGEFGQSISGIFGSITSSIGGMSLGWGAVIAGVVALVLVIIQNWDAIKAAIGTAAEWLNTNIIQPIVGFCTELWTSISTIVSQIWEGVVAVCSAVGQWIYDNVIAPVMALFSPLIEWYAQLFGSVWQTISDIFYNIGVIICGCWDIIKAVWGIVASWFSESVIQPVLGFFVQLGRSIGEFATGAWNAICSAFSAVGTWFYQNVIQPVGKFFSDMWNGFVQGAINAWEGVKSAFFAVTGFFGKIFGEAWAAVVKVFDVAGDIFVNIRDGILGVFKTIVNGLIDGINAVVAIPFDGLNGALRVIKNVEIAGITPFDRIRLLSVPQIPHLAQGAVLPANRPFMAIVGDQRYGTNVEAPLSTIQEAVDQVMVGPLNAVLDCLNDSVDLQQRLLGAVAGIRIGDEVIGRAARRYERRQAMMGGY